MKFSCSLIGLLHQNGPISDILYMMLIFLLSQFYLVLIGPWKYNNCTDWLKVVYKRLFNLGIVIRHERHAANLTHHLAMFELLQSVLVVCLLSTSDTRNHR